jgi:hypothetical protein
MMVEHGQSLVCRKELTPFVCSRRVLRDAECTRCKRDAHESAHATGAAMSIVVSVRVRHATRNWSVLAMLTDGQKTALALEVTLPRMHLLPCCIPKRKAMRLYYAQRLLCRAFPCTLPYASVL